MNIPPALAEALAELQRDELLVSMEARLDKLMQRECMEKVWQELAAKLDAPEDPAVWRSILLDILGAANTAEAWKPLIKPARRDFEKRRRQAARAGREFLARLGELAEGWAGYKVPDEVHFLPQLLIRGAIAKGDSHEAAWRLYWSLLEDGSKRFDALYRGEVVPSPLAPSDVVAALVEMMESWDASQADEHPEQSQGTKAPQVFVRAINRALLDHSETGSPGFPSLEDLPHGRLLTLEALARLTRAALDIPDEVPGHPHRLVFNAEDARRALEDAGE